MPNLNDILDACGLDAITVVATAGKDDANVGQNPDALLFKVLRPGRYFAFGSLRHPRSGSVQDPLPYEEQARRLIAMGCDGMKMLEGKPTVRKKLERAARLAAVGCLLRPPGEEATCPCSSTWPTRRPSGTRTR